MLLSDGAKPSRRRRDSILELFAPRSREMVARQLTMESTIGELLARYAMNRRCVRFFMACWCRKA